MAQPGSWYDPAIAKDPDYDEDDHVSLRPEWLVEMIQKVDKKGRFRNLVQSLPPKIFNEIYQLTFCSFKPTTVIIGIDDPICYGPPKLLQVDPVSRKIAAKSYYNNTTFIVCVMLREDKPYFEPHDNAGRWWLGLLPPEHRRELREVRVVCCGGPDRKGNKSDVKYVGFKEFGLKLKKNAVIVEDDGFDAPVVTLGLNGHVPTAGVFDDW